MLSSNFERTVLNIFFIKKFIFFSSFEIISISKLFDKLSTLILKSLRQFNKLFNEVNVELKYFLLSVMAS